MIFALRICLIILTAWLMVAGLYIPGVVLALVYILYFSGTEIVIAAILIDGYYQHFYSVPLFSIAALASVLLAEFSKPFLLMYTK